MRKEYKSIKLGTILEYYGEDGCFLKTKVTDFTEDGINEVVMWTSDSAWQKGEKEEFGFREIDDWLQDGSLRISKESRFRNLIDLYERTKSR